MHNVGLKLHNRREGIVGRKKRYNNHYCSFGREGGGGLCSMMTFIERARVCDERERERDEDDIRNVRS
jgi:hypothetical protein